MRVSYIINTCALDPHTNTFRNPYRTAGYVERAALLRNRILPAAMEQYFDEIIVAGVFEHGTGYQYVPVAPRYRDRRDALVQREMGARHATGDVLVFGHDDHALVANFHRQLEDYNKRRQTSHARHLAWDLLIPKRIHGITGATLNNGQYSKPEPMMGGHVLVMKRWLWAECPWTSVDTEWWDTSMTRLWKAAGGKLVYADDLQHIDVEAKENEA